MKISMLRLLKLSGWLALFLTLTVLPARAFTLGGPFEDWQDNNLSYGFVGDINAPKNLGEEYRWNTPYVYYAFDASFLDYFGSNGVVAIEKAIKILSNHLSFQGVSQYSEDLSEVPVDATRINHQAEALHLLDLKSLALHLLVEQLGLAEPDRYTWTLRDRIPNLTCPSYIYNVIKRNFDPVTLAPSSYVNGALYSYRIFELCPTPDRADAVEYLVDPVNTPFTAVASQGIASEFSDVNETDQGAVHHGRFFMSLTRDDVGGLRYLLKPTNRNVESVPASALQIYTVPTQTNLLFTSNLTLLVNQALTNDAPALQALYPNLLITSTTPIYTNIVSTNFFAYFTNSPFAPAGTVVLVFQTNITTNVAIYFSHTFGNVVTNLAFGSGKVSLLTTEIGPKPFGIPGVLYTNVTVTPAVTTNFISGSYYILPTNSPCGAAIVSTQLVWVSLTTNTFVTATNDLTVTNVNGRQFSQSTVFYVTNYAFLINPVVCITNSVALREGIDKMFFIRRDFDSLLGRFFQPITNDYTLYAVTNSTRFPQKLTRVVDRPDIVFTASDLNDTLMSRTMIFNETTSLTNQATPLGGPGTIEAPVEFSFSKVGPLFRNSNPGFIDEASQFFLYQWGTFDGSTNAPIAYPIGNTIEDLESRVLMDFTPGTLPSATRGAAYSITLTGSGGFPPYRWELSPTSPALPPGLTLTEAGVLSGVPTVAVTNTVSLRMNDAGNRFVDRERIITVVAP